MEIKIQTTDVQFEALTKLATDASITSEEYLQLRVNEVLDSYVSIVKTEKVDNAFEKFQTLSEVDKDAAVLFIESKVPPPPPPPP